MPALSGSSPTAVNNVVYMGCGNHLFQALNATDGSVIWDKETSWWVSSAAYFSNNTLYLSTGDGVLAAFDAGSGNVLWYTGLPSVGLGGMCPVVGNNAL